MAKSHWKKLMDPKDMLYAYDLDGRDVTVEIVKVTGGELTGEQGRKTKKPIAQLKGTPKKLALNNTNCTTIEQISGTSDYTKWDGVRVTLFATTTNFGGKTVDCIRIRPFPPKDKPNGKRDAAAAASLGEQREESATTAPTESSSAPDPDDDIPLLDEHSASNEEHADA